MLGHSIADPHSLEHDREVEALSFLPFTTRMNPNKVTRLTTGSLASSTLFGQSISATSLGGYEIHVGETFYHPSAAPFAILEDGTHDGCVSPDGRISGTASSPPPAASMASHPRPSSRHGSSFASKPSTASPIPSASPSTCRASSAGPASPIRSSNRSSCVEPRRAYPRRLPARSHRR
jgi:hypothetical protein